MASIAEHRMHGREGMDRVASSIAFMLGLSALLMLYQAYADLSSLNVAAGAFMLAAALTMGWQAHRRSREASTDSTAMMRALAEALPQAVTIRNAKGDLLFANSAAQNTNDRQAAAVTAQRFPWCAADGRLLGWVEVNAEAGSCADHVPALSEHDVECRVAQRTTQVRELMAHVETCREEEKKALARKVHGELGSSLTAISIHLAILSRQLPETPALHERLKEMKALLGSAAEVMRQIQSGLRPDKLELFGLNTAIEELADSVSQSSGIAFNLDLPEESPSYPSHLEIAAYRMLEQVLDNVAQHAYATRVNIALEEKEGQLKIVVSDNGVGFNPHETPSGAYGLCSLRERVAYLGGQAEILSAPGKGTRISISLPAQCELDALQLAS